MELDRFTATLGVIQAYACAKCHVPGAQQARAHIQAPDVASDSTPPGLEAFFSPKAPYEWPEWIANLEESAPRLMHSLQVFTTSCVTIRNWYYLLKQSQAMIMSLILIIEIVIGHERPL